MAERNPRRGIHLPNTQGSRLLAPWEYEALGLMHVGSVTLMDYQLVGDPQLARWLERRVRDGLQVFVRIYLRPDERPTPEALAKRLADTALLYPWVTAWQPCNEPNIEGWVNDDWATFDQWAMDLWWNVNYYRGARQLRIRLIYPPFAQYARGKTDPPDHIEGWNACRRSIEHWLDHDELFGHHDYWPTGSGRLIELEMPDWLIARVRWRNVLVVGECGRLPGESIDGLENDLCERYGSWKAGAGSGWSGAFAVTPWLLASRDPAFAGAALVSEDGAFTDALYGWAWFGP